MAQPARVELDFRPNAHLVTEVRRFVTGEKRPVANRFCQEGEMVGNP
jgi:hypothetical protein